MSMIRFRRWKRIWLPLVAGLSLLCAAPASATLPAGVTFAGDFEPGDISQWTSAGGRAQCANYGTPSSGIHQRGDLYMATYYVGQGNFAGRIDLPANVSPYTTTVCELIDPVALGVGSDQYYGEMFFVPAGWTPRTSAFWGLEIAQWHFENIWGAPIGFQLHPDHLTLALETGACTTSGTTAPGCQYRSNADTPYASGPDLPAYYVIPPNAFVPGSWYEVIMHVHWATDSSGVIETWYRTKGASNWIASASVTGIPTVQWVSGQSAPAKASDHVGGYRGYSTAKTSVWIDNVTTGTDFNSIAATMP